MFDGAWHHSSNPTDVNDDGLLTPFDVLTIVNELNKGELTDADGRLIEPTAVKNPPPYVDVNDDGFLSPVDALIVVNGFGSDDLPPVITASLEPNASAPANDRDTLYSQMPTVVGSVRDDVTGVVSLSISLDGGRPVPISFDRNGNFRFATASLDNSVPDGLHQIALVARDVVGNESSALKVTFELDRTTPGVKWSIRHNDVDVLARPWIEAEFSEPVMVDGANTAGGKLPSDGIVELRAADQVVRGSVIFDESGKRLRFLPNEDLFGSREFTLGIGERVRDEAGNAAPAAAIQFDTQDREPVSNSLLYGQATNFPDGSRVIALNAPELEPAMIRNEGFSIRSPGWPLLLEFQVPAEPGSGRDFDRAGIFQWAAKGDDFVSISLQLPPEPFPPYSLLREGQPTIVLNPVQLPGWSLRMTGSMPIRADGTEAQLIRMLNVGDDLLPAFAPPAEDSSTAVFVDVAGGDAVFTAPVAIVAPNEDNLPAGEKLALWSFDPTMGVWNVVGQALVADDGYTIYTVDGQGARRTGLYAFSRHRQAGVSSERPSHPQAATGRVFYRVRFPDGDHITGWSDSGSEFVFSVPQTGTIVIEAAEPLRGLYGRRESIVSPDDVRVSIPPVILEETIPHREGFHGLDARIEAILNGLELPAETKDDVIHGFDPQPPNGKWYGEIEIARFDLEIKDLAAGDGYLYVAAGADGLQILDISRPADPILISKTATSAPASAIAVRGTTVAVSESNGNVDLFDVSDPHFPALITQISGRQTSAMALYGDVLLINDGAHLESHRISSGERIDQVWPGCIESIEEIAVISNLAHIYCRTDFGYTIQSYWIDGNRSLAPGLFTHAGEGHIKNPSATEATEEEISLAVDEFAILIASSQGFDTGYYSYNTDLVVPSPTESPLKAHSYKSPIADAALDGAGFQALIKLDGDTPRLEIIPAFTSDYHPTGVTSPDFQAVSLARGIAYVGGPLSVVRYDHDDGKYNEFYVQDVSLLGVSQVGETRSAAIHVRLPDAYKADYVALVHDGRVVATDASFPIELDFFPNPDDPSASYDLMVRIVSRTGAVQNYPVRVEFDNLTTPTDQEAPVIAASDPAPGSILWNVDTIRVQFTEGLDSARFALDGFRLSEAGVDEVFGTSDDISSRLGDYSFADSKTLVLQPSERLASGRYRLQLDPQVVADVLGNVPDSPLAFDFAIADLDAHADLGTPRVASDPSANPGQQISVAFPGAGYATRLTFNVRDKWGDLSSIEVRPLRVETDKAIFVIPESATTGKVHVSGVDEPFHLQIVSTLSSARGGERLILSGTGLNETFIQIKIGDTLVYPSYSSYRHTNGHPFTSFEFPLYTNASGPITVTTLGGESNALSTGGRLTEIIANAPSGTPADSSLPSANPGQVIRLRGENLSADSLVHFPVNAMRQFVRPSTVSDDGSEITVKVPLGAETGNIGLIGESTEPGPWLQVVPVLTSVDAISRCTAYPCQGFSVVVGGSIIATKTTYHFGNTSVADENWLHDRVEVDRVRGLAFIQLPIGSDFSGPVSIETAGGVSAPFTVQFDRIESVAASGTPENPELPSANPGQDIILHGAGFTMQTVIIAEYRNSYGDQWFALLDPISVSPDGSRLVAIVPPELSGTYSLRVLGAVAAPILQIVPVSPVAAEGESSAELIADDLLQWLGKGDAAH